LFRICGGEEKKLLLQLTLYIYTQKAYLHLIVGDEVGIQYITYHNVAYQMRLMQQIRYFLLIFGMFVFFLEH
jgi:hypothetical protein